jgi:hypothetical protein
MQEEYGKLWHKTLHSLSLESNTLPAITVTLNPSLVMHNVLDSGPRNAGDLLVANCSSSQLNLK